MNIVVDFCKEFGLPNEALEYLSEEYEKLKAVPSAFEAFSKYVSMYEKDYEMDFTPIFDAMGEISKVSGVKKYTLDYLYMISLVPHLKELYEQKGIAYEILYDSVCDLKWKIFECKELYKFWGTFVGWWTIGFFKLKRFAFGRLQFNLRTFSRDFEHNGTVYKEGDIYLDVHIPSSGPLKYDECISSYKRAAEFFKDYFVDKPIIFGCRSWILSSNNYKILPETSNVLSFMKDYTILEEKKDDNNSNLWRIFGTFSLPSNPENLPQDTSLRRAFVKWLNNGNTIDEAFGILMYEKIRD